MTIFMDLYVPKYVAVFFLLMLYFSKLNIIAFLELINIHPL